MATRATKTSPSHVTIQWQKKTDDLPIQNWKRKHHHDYIKKGNSLHLTNMLSYPILSCLCLNLDPSDPKVKSSLCTNPVHVSLPTWYTIKAQCFLLLRMRNNAPFVSLIRPVAM